MVRTAFVEERELIEGMLDWMSAARAPRLSGSADASTRSSSAMVSPGSSCERGWKGKSSCSLPDETSFQDFSFAVGTQMRDSLHYGP